MTLKENQDQFPSVAVTPVSVRAYPDKELAAQVLGSVGSISPGELKLPRFKGVPDNGVVGQAGVEWQYDQFLRGRDGIQRVQVDSAGLPSGKPPHTTPPTSGHELKLLARSRPRKGGLQGPPGAARGARPEPTETPATPGRSWRSTRRNGQVLAMGSAAEL